MSEHAWKGFATHCEDCAERKASVLVLAAIRPHVMTRHIPYCTTRIVSRYVEVCSVQCLVNVLEPSASLAGLEAGSHGRRAAGPADHL